MITAFWSVSFPRASFAIAPNITSDIEIFMAGSSAQDTAIASLFGALCNTGTLDIFKDNNRPGSEGSDHTAYYCTISSTSLPGLSINGQPVVSAKVLLHKRSQGGSGMGVSPLINGIPIAAMRIDAGNCVQQGSTNNWYCNANSNNLMYEIPDIGVSDVEPELFIYPNQPSSVSAVDPQMIDATINVKPAAALLFGVPVSDNLYVALQRAQNLLTGFGGNCATGEYTQACMPSLSKQQIATLISGQIKRWSEFKINGIALTSITAGLTYDSGDGIIRNVTPTDTKVHYCKGVDGSGIGALMYAKFLNNPCSVRGLNADWGGSGLVGPVKHEVSSSKAMEVCLEDFADGENNAYQITSVAPDVFNTAVNPNANTAWALGMQSTENNTSHAKHYRFIKIDGAAPTLENVFRGKYIGWGEQSYQWRKTVSQDKETIINAIVTDAGHPYSLAQNVNPNFVHPFGQAGYMALGKNYPFTDSLNLTSPVIPYSHEVSGKLSNCQVPVIPSSSNDSKPM